MTDAQGPQGRRSYDPPGWAEELVARDTTDCGERERSLKEKVEDVIQQLRRGAATVVFDAETGTVTIVLAGPQHTR